jgi:hypothetical protein
MRRWKLWVPLLRCPACRRWLKIMERGQWTIKLASKKDVEAAGQRDPDLEDAANDMERRANA